MLCSGIGVLIFTRPGCSLSFLNPWFGIYNYLWKPSHYCFRYSLLSSPLTFVWSPSAPCNCSMGFRDCVVSFAIFLSLCISVLELPVVIPSSSWSLSSAAVILWMSHIELFEGIYVSYYLPLWWDTRVKAMNRGFIWGYDDRGMRAHGGGHGNR